MRVNGQSEPNTITIEFLDIEKVLADFETLSRQRDDALWAMGEIVDRMTRTLNASEGIRREFARQGVSLRQFARQVGVTPATLGALRLTASTFAPRERNHALSWEHHHLIAKHLGAETPSIRRRWLRDAAKQGWTTRQLTQRLRSRKTPAPAASTLEDRVSRLRARLAEAEAALERQMAQDDSRRKA